LIRLHQMTTRATPDEPPKFQPMFVNPGDIVVVLLDPQGQQGNAAIGAPPLGMTPVRETPEQVVALKAAWFSRDGMFRGRAHDGVAPAYVEIGENGRFVLASVDQSAENASPALLEVVEA
jgi:hypothetical protein